MRIGIMSAMPEEAATIEYQLQNKTMTTIGLRDYAEGILFGKDVVTVYSRCGKVAAASTATTLIDRFGVDCILFTGVAGAVVPELSIGDIVIAKRTYQYDLDAEPIFKKREVPLLHKTFFETDPDISLRAQKAAEAFLANLKTCFSAEDIRDFSIASAKVMTGTIGTGDRFVSDSAMSQNLHDTFPEAESDLIAVEMEGAAVAQVCFEHDVPFVLIRTISDNANHHAPIDFSQFIERIARHYSEEILRHMFERW